MYVHFYLYISIKSKEEPVVDSISRAHRYTLYIRFNYYPYNNYFLTTLSISTGDRLKNMHTLKEIGFVQIDPGL